MWDRRFKLNLVLIVYITLGCTGLMEGCSEGPGRDLGAEVMLGRSLETSFIEAEVRVSTAGSFSNLPDLMTGWRQFKISALKVSARERSILK